MASIRYGLARRVRRWLTAVRLSACRLWRGLRDTRVSCRATMPDCADYRSTRAPRGVVRRARESGTCEDESMSSHDTHELEHTRKNQDREPRSCTMLTIAYRLGRFHV